MAATAGINPGSAAIVTKILAIFWARSVSAGLAFLSTWEVVSGVSEGVDRLE